MIYRLMGFACAILAICAAPCLQAQNKDTGTKAKEIPAEETQLNLLKSMHWNPRIDWSGVQYAYPSPVRYSRRTPGNSRYNPPPIIMFNERGDMALIWDPVFNRFRWMPIIPSYPGRLRPPIIIYGPGMYDTETEEQPAQAEPAQQSAVRTSVGEVVRVLPDRSNPRIVVNVGGQISSFAIPADALLLRGAIGGRLSEVPLGDIRPGDRVILQFIGRESVSIVRAQYFVITGKVQSIAVNTILLDSGATLRISAETEIVLPGNVTGTTQDIEPGDMVAARVAPVSGRTFLIKVLGGRYRQPAAAEEEEDQVTLNSTGPFRAGDIFAIEFSAEAGGQAFFTIPGVASDVPMTEVEPGIYHGEYSVEPGDIAVREQVTVTFKAPSGATYTRTSGLPVTIRTVAGYLPRITFPQQGGYISSPVVVKGISRPGALIRVSVVYRADIQNVLPIEGLSAVEDVEAGADGKWQTSPLAATSPFYEDSSRLPDYFGVFSDIFKFPEERPVVYIVTAASVDANGDETAAYSVQVTKAPGRIMVR